jgi:hypothetical protein
MRNFWRIFREGRRESTRPIRQSPTHLGFEEDVRILQLLKPRLPERPVILDVGASNGSWTREILKTFPGATVSATVRFPALRLGNAIPQGRTASPVSIVIGENFLLSAGAPYLRRKDVESADGSDWTQMGRRWDSCRLPSC